MSPTHAPQQTEQSHTPALATSTQLKHDTTPAFDTRPVHAAQRRAHSTANTSRATVQLQRLQTSIQNQPQAQSVTAQLQESDNEKPNNTGLPNQLKAGIESMSGISMDHVKVHYNSDKPAQLNAHAYAQGSDIHVAPGQEQHLPHEAWHVVQQAQGRVQPTMQMKMGVPVNDDAGLENEADVMGAKAMQFKSHDRSDQYRSAMNTVSTSLQRVVQRLTNPAPAVGTPTSYQVLAADLGNGTGTTAPVRAWANANAPGPNPVNFRYAASNPATGALAGPWIGPFAAPNPAPAFGANWHAGHILARQNGGAGHLAAANWIMPQNPQVNMGHAGTYGLWRAHEVAFNGLVAANGAGVWHVW